MNGELWLFIEHNHGNTWTRAQVPAGITSPRELVSYLQRGGQIQSPWIDLPARARFTPRAIRMTVIARLEAA